jgi:protein involved in ribonucleotide reduction
MDIIYFSNRSGNTKRFVEKLGYDRSYSVEGLPFATREYVLFVPTYGGGKSDYAIPRPVATFLNIKTNRELLRAVVGFGNMNFGKDYCKAAKLIAKKANVPILGMVEIFGTPQDVETIRERLEIFNDTV